MLERLQRALDRVECAQSVLEAIGFRTHRGGDVTPDDTGVREAVALLARRWPKDYPTDAVEWMLLRRSRDVGATAVSRL
jgi:hypothetical protein